MGPRSCAARVPYGEAGGGLADCIRSCMVWMDARLKTPYSVEHEVVAVTVAAAAAVVTVVVVILACCQSTWDYTKRERRKPRKHVEFPGRGVGILIRRAGGHFCCRQWIFGLTLSEDKACYCVHMALGRM